LEYWPPTPEHICIQRQNAMPVYVFFSVFIFIFIFPYFLFYLFSATQLAVHEGHPEIPEVEDGALPR
jgi:hypothetical protein